MYIVLISTLLVFLVVGIQYTVYNCRKLVQTVRGNERNETTDAYHRVDRQVIGDVTAQLKSSTKTCQKQLGQELQSMQQLQVHVATQLTELKQVLAQYAAVQQQQQNDDGGGNIDKQE